MALSEKLPYPCFCTGLAVFVRCTPQQNGMMPSAHSAQTLFTHVWLTPESPLKVTESLGLSFLAGEQK